jgi:hypothetical protein
MRHCSSPIPSRIYHEECSASIRVRFPRAYGHQACHRLTVKVDDLHRAIQIASGGLCVAMHRIALQSQLRRPPLSYFKLITIHFPFGTPQVATTMT